MRKPDEAIDVRVSFDPQQGLMIKASRASNQTVAPAKGDSLNFIVFNFERSDFHGISEWILSCLESAA
jgi:hypothetical protein